MKKVALLVALLAGCTHPKLPAEIEPSRPVVANTIVTPPPAAACVKRSEIPVEPPQVGGKFTGDAKHDLLILAPNAQQLRKWGQQLRRLLERCADSP